MSAVLKSAPFAERDLTVPLAEIDAHQDERFRPVLSEAGVLKAMASLGRRGLKQRIGVCHQGKRYRLVWGAHRTEAARRLGWTTIEARLVDHARASRELDEIEENLVRQNLSPLDEAAHTVRALELLAEEIGVKVGTNARTVSAAATNAKRAIARTPDLSKSDIEDARDKMALAYNLQDQLADRAGISTRSIKRAVELHRGFSDDEKAALRETDFAQNASQLRRLAKLQGEHRRLTIDAIVRLSAATLNDAEAIANGVVKRPSQEDAGPKRVKRMRAWWLTLTLKQRAELLDLLALDAAAHARLPKGYRIVTPTSEALG